MQGAALGVDGFFALSGFLITTLLLQEWRQNGSISLKRFYIRRALRLLPALYAMLAVFGILTIIAIRGEGAIATWRGILLSFFYSGNLDTVIFQDYTMGLGLMSHTWSLALEEQFYLLWPILLIGLLSLRMSSKRLAVCIGGLVLVAPLWRFLLMRGGNSTELYFLGMNTRTDALLVGCTLGALAVGGLVVPSVKAARVTRWLALLGTAVLGYLILDDFWLHEILSYYGMFTAIALCAGALILHLLVSPQGRMAQLLSWKPLVQIGVVSYGVYLWHNPIFHLVRTGSAGWADLPVQFVRLAITAALVVLSYRYLEKPMLSLKERFAGKVEARPQPPVGSYVTQTESV